MRDDFEVILKSGRHIFLQEGQHFRIQAGQRTAEIVNYNAICSSMLYENYRWGLIIFAESVEYSLEFTPKEHIETIRRVEPSFEGKF